MNCPIDGTELLITHRQNVEIDYCPRCRGIWLDQGELDKIIEHSIEDKIPVQSGRIRSERFDENDEDAYRMDKRDKVRRKSFLEDLFDF